MLLKIIFWVLLAGIGYTYLGYGLLAWTWVRLRGGRGPAPQPAHLPTVALVIPAYNEAGILRAKMLNSQALRYPADRVKIIVVTDGSSDGSEQIPASFPGVLHLHEPERRGKIASINRAVHFAAGQEILVFTDANTLLNADALLQLVSHYGDPQVGGVSGEKKVLRVGAGVTGEEGAYWRYESTLKKLDAEWYSIVGAAGELFSMRAALFQPVPPGVVLDDFYLSMKICEAGFVVRYEPSAVATENPSLSMADERERKIRISAGAFQALRLLGHLANPFRYGLLGFQFLSRRVFRWLLCPLALPLVLIINLFLVYMRESPIMLYQVLLLMQGLFYLFAAVGWILSGFQGKRCWLFSVPYYFIFMNLSVWFGFFRYINGGQSTLWQKAAR